LNFTVVIVSFGDIEECVSLRSFDVSKENDVDVTISLESFETGLVNGNDGLLDLFAQPLEHEVLRPGTSEVSGHTVFEEDKGREALDLQLCLQGLAFIEVDFG
jgi:hypothetical protein